MFPSQGCIACKLQVYKSCKHWKSQSETQAIWSQNLSLNHSIMRPLSYRVINYELCASESPVGSDCGWWYCSMPLPDTNICVHLLNVCRLGAWTGDRARGGWWEFELRQWGERARGSWPRSLISLIRQTFLEGLLAAQRDRCWGHGLRIGQVVSGLQGIHSPVGRAQKIKVSRMNQCSGPAETLWEGAASGLQFQPGGWGQWDPTAEVGSQCRSISSPSLLLFPRFFHFFPPSSSFSPSILLFSLLPSFHLSFLLPALRYPARLFTGCPDGDL